jgi:hypothetical protein
MKTFATFVLTLCLLTCTPLEQSARNTAAALQGALGTAQTQYQTTCTANPSQTPCTVINQAIAGQNALVTATEAYCGWSPTTPPASTTAPCVPVKGATAGLNAAINNASLFVTELQSLITAKGATP